VITPDELAHLADVLWTSLDEVAGELGDGGARVAPAAGEHEQSA
jgi:hypothetical protein